MRLPHLRFTIRRMMILAAVLALILGGYVAYLRNDRWMSVRRAIEQRTQAINEASRKQAEWEALIANSPSKGDSGIVWQRAEFERMQFSLWGNLHTDLSQACSRGFVYRPGDPIQTNARVLADVWRTMLDHGQRFSDNQREALDRMNAEAAKNDLESLPML